MPGKRNSRWDRQLNGHKILGELPTLHAGVKVCKTRRNFRALIVFESFGQQFKIIVLVGGLSVSRDR